MIVFDLECRAGGHRFEGWFGSSDDYASQQERGFVTCPNCGSVDVGKALMAPRIGRKGNQMPELARKQPVQHVPGSSMPESAPEPTVPSALPPQAIALMQKLVTMQAEALKSSRFVGENFAEDARAMHYGERKAETIHGQTTLDEAYELIEEGIAVAPLPFSVVPPEQAN